MRDAREVAGEIRRLQTEFTSPRPMLLWCPECLAAHLDEGEWAVRLHKTHQCQACGHEWRPYACPTVGVASLVASDPEKPA